MLRISSSGLPVESSMENRTCLGSLSGVQSHVGSPLLLYSRTVRAQKAYEGLHSTLDRKGGQFHVFMLSSEEAVTKQLGIIWQYRLFGTRLWAVTAFAGQHGMNQKRACVVPARK